MIVFRDNRLWGSMQGMRSVYRRDFDLEGGETIVATVHASDRLRIAGSNGDLRVLSIEDGNLLAEHKLPAPLWDGLAVAAGRLFVSTAAGRLLCLGNRWVLRPVL